MLQYLITTDPLAIVGLVAVFIGISVCPPLSLKGGAIASWAVVGGFVFTIGGAVLACHPALAQSAGPNDSETIRDFVRVLLTIVIGIALSVAVEMVLGYRAGRRGGFRTFIKFITR
jgi:hypothetical protein